MVIKRLRRTSDATLDHDVVALDDTVVTEATHRGNFLLGRVVRGARAEAVLTSLADLVHLLVELRTMVVTMLTHGQP